tara:strand:- start:562 stop:954 length:393 start_codon:yes stop_codon:yes gene_type:complete
MSATVTNTLTITSSNLTTDVISLSVVNTMASATQGGMTRQKIVGIAPGSAVVIADEDLYTPGAKIWLYNPSTATTNEKIYVSFDSTTDQIILSGGDWAIIPWSASGSGTPVDLEAWSEVTNNILEFGIFN